MLWKYFIQIGFFLGLLANSLLFIPQAIKLYRIKSAKDISIITFLGFNIIQAFIVMHAYLAKDTLLMIGTLTAFITCGAVTCLAIIYKDR